MSGSVLNQFTKVFVRNSGVGVGHNGNNYLSRFILLVRWRSSLQSNLAWTSSLSQKAPILPNNNNKSLVVTSPSSTLKIYPYYNDCKCISTSAALLAEPLKKKKKMDPAVIKHREERRKKKLEKAIRRLEKVSKQLKPLEEVQVPVQLLEEPRERERRLPVLSTEEANDRWRLQKEWCQYKRSQHSKNMMLYSRIMKSQENALANLKLESEDLYIAACNYDESLLPYNVQGPVDTPPIENYQTPNGDFVDISKKWE